MMNSDYGAASIVNMRLPRNIPILCFVRHDAKISTMCTRAGLNNRGIRGGFRPKKAPIRISMMAAV